MSLESWTIIAAICQVVASVAVVIGIPFALFQLREATRARNLEVLARTFEEFRSEVFFEDRRFVYSHEQFDYDCCDEAQRTRLERLINTYNRIAFLVLKGLTSRQLVLELYSGAFIASWQKLEGYVRARRAYTGFSDWAIHFEQIAELAEKYRGGVLKEHHVKYKVPRAGSKTSGT
jgi:hypothetical protein